MPRWLALALVALYVLFAIVNVLFATDVLPQQGINVYDILRRDVLVLSKDAAAHLEERLK